jgi:predicted nucleic-acid-binding protein
MKNITVLDTNVILRYLLNDHPQHFQIAQTLMTEVKKGHKVVYIPDSVLAECIYVLLKVYKVPKIEICDSLLNFLSYTGISQENRAILISSLTLFSKHKVDFVDAIVYATSKHKQWGLFSFDHDIKKFD